MDNNSDNIDDIYTQLDQFEHSLDNEIQNIEQMLSSDDVEKKNSVATNSSSSDDDDDDDGCSSALNCIHNNNSKDCADDEEEEFMPPPSSWFQELDDQYILDGKDKATTKQKKQQQQQKDNVKGDIQKNRVKQQEQNIIINNNNDHASAREAVFHDINYRVHSIVQPSSSDESAATNPTTDEVDINNNTSNIKEEEDDDILMLLPEYNSDDAHLFDLPIIQQPNPYSTQTTSNTCARDVTHDELTTSSSSIQQQQLITTSTVLTTTLSTILKISQTTISTTIPSILHEYTTSAISKCIHKIRLEYNVKAQKYLRASDIGNCSERGYYVTTFLENGFDNNNDYYNENAHDDTLNDGRQNAATRTNDKLSILSTVQKNSIVLNASNSKDTYLDYMWASSGKHVRFTTLPWIERQLVREWRTYEWKTLKDMNVDDGGSSCCVGDAEENEEKIIRCENEKLDDGKELENDDKDEMESSDMLAHVDETEIEDHHDNEYEMNDDDDLLHEYERARTLAPRPLPKPTWEHATSCYACHKPFSPTLHRHHCRRCGHSYCNVHSNYEHKLPHLGYDGNVPERVCKSCKVVLDSRDLEERVSWRLLRCRDYLEGELTPYFETGVDTVEDAAYRLTRLAISLARSIPLGAQAYVAIETVEVLRKHGLKGVYGLLLRKEFLAAADLLCRVLGINKKNWPLSVHELSAAIFYALAQHRALRGVRPDGEEMIHSLISNSSGRNARLTSSSLPIVHENNTEESEKDDDEDEAGDTIVWEGSSKKYLTGEFSESVLDETDVYDPNSEKVVDLLDMSTSASVGGQKVVTVSDDNNVESNNGAKDDATTPQQTKLPFEPVCEEVPNSLISSLLFYAPLALDFIYAECEVDMQLLAAQQGWRLVYASLDQNHHHHANDGSSGSNNNEGTLDMSNETFSDKPASALFAHDKHKVACLSIRGTATIQDVVTDIRATPVPFPQQEEEGNEADGNNSSQTLDVEEWTSVFKGSGLALCGMAGAASNLFRETADSLLYLALNGYKIRIVGHSLGGGVAALLGILVLRHFEKHCANIKDSPPSSSDNATTITDDGFVRVYSYGTPSCVDSKLADHPRLKLFTSVVLHDDVVPRLTPTSVRGLLKHLLYIRETWVKTHLSDDLNAITERAYHVWPTRLRGSFTLLKKKGVASAKRLKKSCKKRIQTTQSTGEDCNTTTTSSINTVCANDDMSDVDATISDDEGVDIEGELFFDPLDDPINESDDESSAKIINDMVEDDEWAPFDEPPMESDNDAVPSANIKDSEALSQQEEEQPTDLDADSSPQILEELPLPRMFIPGKIVHIYTHRGGYKAAFVPRKFRSLRRISMAGNMLSDHMSRAYYEGLLEVKAIRAAKQDLPPWVGFAEDCTCACCASLFTWASTSNTEAQAARDKHNCRACGSLVCDPCSKKRVPIPNIGITASVRVCDRCYNGWGTLYGDDNVGTNDRESLRGTQSSEEGSDKPVNSRRSAVVDELVSRIPH